jgi:sugar phosphate isomerase/epimerase
MEATRPITIERPDLKNDAPAAEIVFWPGSMMNLGFSDLVDAAAAGGCTSLALNTLTIAKLIAAGTPPDVIIEEARAKSVALTILEAVSSWAPARKPAYLPPLIKMRFGFTVEANLEMASLLGLDTVIAIGLFDKNALEPRALVGPFIELCDRAADLGLRVELEFIPFWGIAELPAAWELIQRADRPNAGLLIDTWHVLKGSSDIDRDMKLLDQIPGHLMKNVQLADALSKREADSLLGEGQFRRFPGDGELAINEIVQRLISKGHVNRIGVEVFGAALDALSPVEAGRRCGAATRDVLRAAAAPHYRVSAGMK